MKYTFNNILIIILIILLCKCCLFISGEFIFKDITDDKTVYKGYISNGACKGISSIVVLLSDPSVDHFISFDVDQQVAAGSSKTIFSNRLTSNDTASIFFLSTNQLTEGQYEFQLKGTNGIESKIIIISYTCQLIPQLSISNDSPVSNINVFGYIGGQFKVNGVSQSLPESGWNSNNAFPKLMFKNVVYYTQAKYNEILPIEINVANTNFFYQRENYYIKDTQNNNTAYNIKSYPNNQQNVKLLGDCILPIFIFNSDTKYYNPPFFMKVDESYSYAFNFRLISTKGTTSTYVGFYDYSNTINNLSKYDFYDLDENLNFKIANSINLNISSDYEIRPIPTSGINNQIDTLVYISFNSNSEYNYYPFYLTYVKKTNLLFPFGFTSGNLKSYTFNSTFLLPDIIPNSYSLSLKTYKSDGTNGFSFVINYNQISSKTPIFKDYEFIHLFEHVYILRIKVQLDIAPIYKIYNSKHDYISIAQLVDGTLKDGTFEIVVNMLSGSTSGIRINDYIQGIGLGGFISASNLKPYLEPPISNNPDFEYLDIKGAHILYKTVNVTNKRGENVLYFNYSNIDTNENIRLLVNGPCNNIGFYSGLLELDQGLIDSTWPAKWNSTIKMFQVEFYIPKNSQPGNVPFALFFRNNIWVSSGSMGDDAQFNVISNNADLYGPFFGNVEVFPAGSSITPTTFPSFFGWNLNILDSVNGYYNGYLIVRGSLDGSTYKFDVGPSPSNSIYNFNYTVSIGIQKCVEQDYIITEVVLFDTENNNSTFIQFEEERILSRSLYNPFINYLDQPDINKISIKCNPLDIVTDTTPPYIVGVSMSKVSIDVGSNDRSIELKIEVTDPDSGLKENQKPTLYLTSVDFEPISCILDNIQVKDANTNYYSGHCEVPLGFGYPYGMLISVYGMINNGGTFGGETSDHLKLKGLTNFINTTFTTGIPVITGSSKIAKLDTQLWLYGKDFRFVTSVIYQYGYVEQDSLTFKLIGLSALLINIPPTSLATFTIYLSTTNSMQSNTIFITPYNRIYGNYIPPITTPTETPSETTTPTPTPTPIITNAPQKCLGNPICGGTEKGQCIENKGCLCFSPWIGLDCGSKVIVVPPPKTNTTNPSTEIPITGDDDDDDDDDQTTSGESSNYLYRSLISLISLREIGYDGSEKRVHPFETWIYTPTNESFNQYFTTIKSSETITTNITVTLQWFKNATTIEFANEQLSMQESTIKYTIEISEYSFQSQLNYLQLVISSTLETNNKNKNICSSKEFGETSAGDNSNYIKIQIDNHSLYGRFIKRGIIEGSKIVSINNVQLDSSFNPIENEKQSQSYIGITIPQYSKSVIIDPDFSVLLDSNSVSSTSQNSICSNYSKSGLSTPQLAGIIVGSVVVFIAISIIAILIFIRSRKHTLLLLRVKDIKMFRNK